VNPENQRISTHQFPPVDASDLDAQVEEIGHAARSEVISRVCHSSQAHRPKITSP
jgi:hypothetical protein